jgi:glycine/D-amino acid oxidase-like deaminating enzyme
LELWREHESQWNRGFFFPIGVLWMAGGSGEFERGSLPLLKDAGILYEQLSVREMMRRWPQINFDEVEWGIYEPGSGYLLARASAQAVVERFIAEGGEYREAPVVPPSTASGSQLECGNWKALTLSDGSKLAADRYVFACGPWLAKLFPKMVGPHLTATKQEVFFFGTPEGDLRYHESNIPVWADHGEHFMYGIPGNQGRGFKIADDTRGPKFDPTSGERLVSEVGLAEARRYLAYRFPGMKDAPLVETRVCQYEDTIDHNFIIDRHPENGNVWIAGGGGEQRDFADIFDQHTEMMQALIIEPAAQLVRLEFEDRQVDRAVGQMIAIGERPVGLAHFLEVERLLVKFGHRVGIFRGDGEMPQFGHPESPLPIFIDRPKHPCAGLTRASTSCSACAVTGVAGSSPATGLKETRPFSKGSLVTAPAGLRAPATRRLP